MTIVRVLALFAVTMFPIGGCAAGNCSQGIGVKIGALFQEDDEHLFYKKRSALLKKVKECESLTGRSVQVSVPGYGNMDRNIVAIAIDDPSYLLTDIHYSIRLDGGLESSLLHYAVTYSAPNVVRVLLERGVDVNATDNFGNTALIVATQSLGSSREMINLLLDSGADPNKSNDRGRVYLDYLGEELIQD